MITIGYLLTSKGWFGEETSSTIAKLVTNIALPTLMISNLMGTFNKNKLEGMSKGLFVPFMAMFICYLIPGSIIHYLRKKRSQELDD
jgi:predicted permease